MKIDNLISNLQKNTAEQDRIIKEQAENATKQHLESFTALLKASNEETKSVLRSNLQTIKDQQPSIKNQQPSIKNALRLNILTGAVLGGLTMLFLVFLGINVWLGYQIKDKKQELAEINLELDQSPLEKRILRSVEFHESKDKKTYFIVAKNSKKTEVFENTSDQKVMKIEK